MTLAEFSNGLRVLLNIDAHEFLGCINAEDRLAVGDKLLWETFRDSPHRTFIRLPTQDQERLFAVIQDRNRKAGLST